MDLSRFLKTGGRARINAGSSSFQTMINEVLDSNVLTLMIPAGYQPSPGGHISVTCITDLGLCVFNADIVNVEHEDEVGIMTLHVNGKINRIQKREAYRAKVSLEVLIKIDQAAPEIDAEDIIPKTWEAKYRSLKAPKVLPEGWLRTYTIDISETGMLVRLEEGTKLEENMMLIIKINQYGINEVLVGIKGRLARSFEAGRKDTDLFVGIQFVNLSPRARDVLMKLVFLCQREKREKMKE